MLTSFKLFFRTITRHKLFSFINILGLTLGFLCTTLIYLFVSHETSYDNFHEKGDRIYRVNQTFIWGEDDSNIASSTGPGVGYAISADLPDVEQVVRIHTPGDLPVRFKEGNQERFFHDERILAADSNFLQVFSYKLKYGDENSALRYPNSVILSEKTANRFFGDSNPLGRLMDIGGGTAKESFKVTGVVAEIENDSYIEFDMLFSLSSIDRISRSKWSWMWTTFETFIVLRPESDPRLVQEKVDQLPRKHAVETLDVMGYSSFDAYVASGKEWNLYLQPFRDIHLYSNNIYNRLNSTGNHKTVKALTGAALFIIILSCINFINLSTSQFTSKAKNVALRKVLGSSKAALRKIYMTEAFLYCFVSALLSLSLLVFILPFFNEMIGLELSFSPIQNPMLPLFFVAIFVAIGLLAGLYPAIFFSAFKPMTAMRGELKTGKSGSKLRSGMMIVQYVLSLLLIICSGIVSQQLRFVFNSDLGFQKDQLLTIDNVHWMSSSKEFAEELRKVEGVSATSLCDATPLMVYNGDQFAPDNTETGSVALNYVLADEDYIPMLGLELIVGRSFEESYADDVNGIILNENAVRSIGWKLDDSILNRQIINYSGEYHVVGVVKDFHYWSLSSAIEPFAIFHSESNAQNGRPLTRIALSLSSNSTEEFSKTMARIESKWNEFLPSRPFDYTIIDQVFRASFEQEDRFGKVLTWFTALTLLIAGLGLLGMVIFSIEQKTKEIGIRKVLGASMLGIVTLFTKGYVKLLLVAFAIASPIGYYFMKEWLNDFEYRIEISPVVFIVAGISLFLISLLISSYHSVKASLMNPAEILKDE